MSRLAAFALDLAAVVAFVLVGRESHAADGSATSVLIVLAPFLIGLVIAWLAVVLADARVEGWPAGVAIWLVTLALGMTLRTAVFGGGVAVSFVLVAGTFLALTMGGWRLAARGWFRRRRAPEPASASDTVHRS